MVLEGGKAITLPGRVIEQMTEDQLQEYASMVLEESQVAMTTLSQVSEQLAASSGDFGGMTIPIIGLGLLASIIALLAGPLED